MTVFFSTLRSFNQLLTAGIAITAFSLLLYALTFNLRDRVARSFAMILASVMVVFVGDAIGSTVVDIKATIFWFNVQWIGIILLPSAYLHFSDALLATTGKPSRGRRRFFIRISYLVSIFFLVSLLMGYLVDDVANEQQTAPFSQSQPLTWVFFSFYIIGMGWALINCWRALRRSVTKTGRRRMFYLLAGAAAPSLGSFPYLLLSPEIAVTFPFVFWVLVTISNLLVSVLLVVMAYAVAFFGVSWPDRVVKRRLFKWLMRGPAAAVVVLTATTFTRRLGEQFGQSYTIMVPLVMVASILLFEYFVTLASPVWERWLFYGKDRTDLGLLQTLEERLLTTDDLKQFLDSILAAVCDQLQVTKAYVVTLEAAGLEMLVSVGGRHVFDETQANAILPVISNSGQDTQIFRLNQHWVLPLFGQTNSEPELLGLMGVEQLSGDNLSQEQSEALKKFSERAALALEDRLRQKQVFTSLQSLTPQVELIQQLIAASRYDSAGVMAAPETISERGDLSTWVKDALNHYWGGPKLTASPLMRLRVVQHALEEHQGNPVNALRSILRQAVERVRPEGDRRFTAEWILYNILEMKFMEGRKVREIALRLAVSEADLYRKQRVAIDAVAAAILEMEEKTHQDGES